MGKNKLVFAWILKGLLKYATYHVRIRYYGGIGYSV